MVSLEGHIAPVLIILFARAACNIDYAMNSIILWQSLVREWVLLCGVATAGHFKQRSLDRSINTRNSYRTDIEQASHSKRVKSPQNTHIPNRLLLPYSIKFRPYLIYAQPVHYFVCYCLSQQTVIPVPRQLQEDEWTGSASLRHTLQNTRRCGSVMGLHLKHQDMIASI